MRNLQFGILLSFMLGGIWVSTHRVGYGADWPQILGANRNGTSSDSKLFPEWPASGPDKVWEHPVGEGYAGAAIKEGVVVVFHRIGRDDVVDALNLSDGSVIWSEKFPTDYVPRVNPDSGPRCVPLVTEEFVYVFGPSGDLRCLRIENGDEVWSRDLYEEYLADEGYFGAGTTPILVRDNLLLNLGGRREAGLIALRPDTGETIWVRGTDQASYSSPVVAEIGGKRIAVFVTRLHAVGVDPSDGTEVFRFEFGARGPTVNAAMPLICDEGIFFSASYGVGGRMEKIGPDAQSTLWQNDNTMSSQYSTCVYRNGHLFGTHGREDVGRVSLRCVNAQTGDIAWSEDGYSIAHVILVDQDLLMLTVDGEVVLADASSDRYRERARAQLFESGSRSLPALSDGMLVVRSNAVNRQGVLSCYRVGESNK